MSPALEDLFERARADARAAYQKKQPPPRDKGGRPRSEPQAGKQVMLYLRQDVREWLQEEVDLGRAENMSQAANQAIRRVMKGVK